MAKIILNVDLNLDSTKESLNRLKESLSTIADSLNKVKPNKDLTEQIKALSDYYKGLTAAAKGAAEADAKAATYAAKVAKAEEDAAKATAQRQKAETDAAAAVARRTAAEARAFDTIEKTKAAMEKRAKAAEEDEKALWNLEKAFASLSKRQEEAASKTNVMDQALRDVAEETEETWKEIRAFNESGEALSSTVDELRERYERLAAQTASYEKELNAQVKAEIEAEREAQRLAESFQKSGENLDGLTLKLNNMLTAISNIEGRYPAGTFDQLKADIQAQIAAIDELKASVSSSGGNMQEFIDKERDAEHATKDLNGRFAELKASTEHATPAVATLGEKFGNLVERYAKFYASSMLVRKPLQLIQNALADVGDTLVETENAVIELNRVLEDPQPATEAANRLYDIAYQYGSTFENASLIAANFARAGRSWNESIQATEAALLAMNVAELNATEASDGLLSVLAQFDMEASDLIDVVDKLNKTADKNPVSTQKLLQAIQRAGSAAKNANVSFDQTLGLITAISEATNRSGQNIGTAVNSLIQYSTKNVDVFATLSKESEEMVEKFKLGLASIVDVWNQVAADIKSDKKARDDIITALGTDGLEELSSTLHDELGDLVSEIDGVYNVANTYRKNYFIALLDNMDRFMDVQEQLTEFQGYSQEENAKYMETYAAKVNQLNTAWQQLANDEQGILGFKKTLVDIGLGIVQLIDDSGGLVNTIKYLSSVAAGLFIFLNTEKLVSGWQKLVTAIAALKTSLEGAATAAMTTNAALGWVGLAIMVVGGLATALNAVKQAQDEQRDSAIALWKEQETNALKLEDLRNKYIELNPESEEYKTIEAQIVELLGDKTQALEGLTEGTDDYRKALIKLTDEQLRNLKLTNYDAITAAKEKVESAVPTLTLKDDYFRSFLRSDQPNREGRSPGSYSAEELYKEYQDFVKKFEALEKLRADALAAGNKELVDKYKERYDGMKSAIDKYSTVMGDYGNLVDKQTFLDNYLVENIEETSEAIETYGGAGGKFVPVTEEAVAAAEDLAGAVGEAGDAAEEAGPKYDKAALGAAKFAEAIAGDKDKLKAEADAIKAVKAAQDEFNENGGLSIETISKLASLGEDWVDVLFDENGAVDVTSNAVYSLLAAKNELLEKNGVLIDSTEEETAAIDAVTEKLEDYSSQIDEVQSALSVLDAAQKEYDETGSISIDTLQRILDLGADYIDLLIDENGKIRLNEQAVEDLKEEKKGLIDKLIEENTAQYALSLIQEIAAQKERQVGKEAGNAALGIGTLVSQLMTLKGKSQDAVEYLSDLRIALHEIGEEMGVALTPEEVDSVLAQSLDYNKKLQSVFGHTDMSGGWESSSGSSSSSSGSQKDEVLEGHKDLVSLLESELTLMEHQGKSEEEQIAKIREIQSALSVQADYLRSIGASQEDINKLSSDWWKWEEKINKFAEDRQKAAEKAAEEAEKARKKAEEDAKKAAEEAKKAAEEAEKARIKALNDETARHKQVVSDLKAELNLWQKQGKSVSDQVEEMKKIQDALHDQAEWLRHLQATESEIKVTQAEIDALSAEWWDWQEKILKLYEETLKVARDIELDAQQKIIDDLLKGFEDIEASRKEELEISEKILAVENARKDVTEAIRNAQLDYIKSTLSGYIKSLSDAKTLEEKQNAVIEARRKLVEAEQDARAKAIIDAFKAEKSVKSDALSIEEKRLAVEKARQALIDAENDRTTRVYNESSGQWEYQANAKNVQTAQDNLKKAIDALNAYAEEQAWKEVSEAVENGSVSEAEVLEILSKWAREAYGEGSPEFVAKIQAAFRKAMGTPASPESLSGQVSAVDKAVENLNEYLKQEAIKELEQYIAAGNTDTAGMRSILNKWLSMGEGGELYAWRDGLLNNLESAISSGWYDETKVTAYIDKVDASIKSLDEYLRSRFIAEIKDIAKNGTAEELRAAIEKWDKRFSDVGAQIGESGFGLSDEDRTWGRSVADAKGQKEDTASMWEKAMAGDKSSGTINWVLNRMKQNSAAWWDAYNAGNKTEADRLRDQNGALGYAQGWDRRADGHWYDENGYRIYDKGGILRGKGGIKATSKPEAVLDPELTAKILTPTSEKQFRAFADAMHLLFERGGRNRYDTPMVRNPSVTDSHNTSYVVNGIPISSGSAERYTIAELFRMLPMARS